MISICIPTYEMNGKGAEYLEYSFNILYHQTFKNFEIVISDHSKSDLIKDLCDKWKTVFNVNYIRNNYKRGNSSANTNNAIKHSSGEIIKILFQDDFLYDEHSLQNQIDCFNKNNNYWLAAACCHYDGEKLYNPHYPYYHDEIQYGRNTISAPSAIMFKNEDILEFDENLISLMDIDYYKRLYNKFGLPAVCNNICFVNRVHKDSVTLSIVHANNSEIHYKEIEYMKKKFPI
jgi:GT2 family glycosyltransferase